MKTKILLFASAILMAMNLQAQAPEKFNYQGIARASNGDPLTNQNLGIQISILNSSSTALYVERHTVTTNDFGLYTLQIGDGTPVTGTMAGVNWAGGTKSIKVEIDPNGGTSYTSLGTTELLSVPYALYAAAAPGGGSGAVWTQTGTDVTYTGGSVGIGTASPTATLQIEGATPTTNRFVQFAPTSIGSAEDILALDAPSAASGFSFIEASDGVNNLFVVQDDGSIETEGKITSSKNSTTTDPHILLDEEGDDYARINFENNNTGYWAIAASPETAAADSRFNVYYNDGTTGYDILNVSGQRKVGVNYAPTGAGTNVATFTVRSEGTNTDHHLSLFDDDPGTAGDDKYDFWATTDLFLYYNGSSIGKFDGSSGVYSTISDRRLKENIQPAGSLLEKVKKVGIMSYSYKRDSEGKTHIGYIAQNLEQQFPEFVNTPKTVEGREIKYYTVNYAGMSAVAIKAIQEQQKVIEAQQATIDKILARLDQLEQQ